MIVIIVSGKACTPLDYTSSLKKKDKNDKQETTTAIAGNISYVLNIYI